MKASISRRALLGSAAAFTAVPRLAGARTTERIRFSGVPTDDMTPIYYALHNGLYERAGIDLEIVTVSSGAVSTAGVVGGAYEMGKASPTQSVIAHMKGLPITIVANGSLWWHTLWNFILVAADSPIKTGADCNGKIAAAANLNDLSQYAVMKWIDQNGGDSKTTRWVEIPGSSAAAAIAEHRVDFGLLAEPLLSAALKTEKVRILGDGLSTVAKHFLTSAYLAQPAWASKHADLMHAFSRVTYAAASYTNAHEAETIPLMSDVTKIPLPVYSAMARVEGSTNDDPAVLQPIIDLALRYKAIDHSFPARDLYF